MSENATPAQLAAVLFVKTQSDAIDEKQGHPPRRETQKKVAAAVREQFFQHLIPAEHQPKDKSDE